MIVYHGSVSEIQQPDIFHSKRFLDFGRGFYVTTYPKQAERWAVRKGLRVGKPPVVNQYELYEQWDGFRVLRFADNDEQWLDFVCRCRKGEEIYKEYDMVVGGVADDDVFKTVDMYFRGIWDKERTIKELRYYQKNDQIAFISQAAIEKLLRFQTAYPAERK